MTSQQAGQLADASTAADTALRGLLWRTRWNLKFEEGIVSGANTYNEVLMTVADQPH